MAKPKSVYYDLFNDKANEFLRDLIDSFPQISVELQKLKTGLVMLRNLDPKSPCTVFNTYVLSMYRDALMNKDETFFLEKNDFGIYSNRKEYWVEFIDSIKSIWKDLDDNNKEIVWKYFHVLVVLSDKCCAR